MVFSVEWHSSLWENAKFQVHVDTRTFGMGSLDHFGMAMTRFLWDQNAFMASVYYLHDGYFNSVR